MTDSTDPLSPDGSESNEEPEGGGPYIHAHAQYIRDLSFENPLAIEAAQEEASPQVNINCSVDSRKLSDQTYEVVLSLEARAMHNEKTLFLASVDYAGLFSVANVPEEHIGQVLNVHCPSLLFPFARSIIANVTRDGGYPPILIDIIDFGSLYFRQQAEAGNGAGNGAGDGAGDGAGNGEADAPTGETQT
jgi:preprotein translocase subunit SecB